MATSRDKHRVKYGPPTKTTDVDVENYMDSRADLREFDTDGKDRKQQINDKLLQIISKGIDDIVLNLKVQLGDDYETSNAKAFEISDFLNQLKDNIDNQTAEIGRNADGTIVNDAIKIDIDGNRSHTVNPNKTKFYRQDDIHRSIDYDKIELQDTHEFKTLDDDYRPVLSDPAAQTVVDSRIEQSSDKDKIERRLKNCQNLEFLYLKKHDEIMKIFEFTINLFDKYKYAIKVILFLLKNLVYKEPGTDTSKIDLPLPIISNIKKLVQDQNSVQGIINDMSNTLNSKYSFDSSKNKEDILNSKILTTPLSTTPPTTP